MSTSSASVAPTRRPSPAFRPPAASPAKPPFKPRNDSNPKPEPKILFQKYFKSVGPRTYAAQVKEASNGNHFLVLTEAKRDDKTDEPRKTRLFIFSEDFKEFFNLLHDTAVFIRENPVPEQIRQKRAKFWAERSPAPPGK